ncbi:MAG: hypothetical protein N2653_03460 [Burkholderiales bacterium]|nr:hypothetical protein [Burkholderiales bacterium]
MNLVLQGRAIGREELAHLVQLVNGGGVASRGSQASVLRGARRERRALKQTVRMHAAALPIGA